MGCGLEKMGGSAAAILEQFPEERFERLVRAEADPEFRPLIQNDPLTQNRFFLVARARSQATKVEGRC